MSTVRDPVCGMNVEEKTAAHKTIRENRVYYFCSASCQAEFIKNPGKYLSQATTDRHAAHYGGYCSTSGCNRPARGLAWYLYIALLFLIVLLVLLIG